MMKRHVLAACVMGGIMLLAGCGTKFNVTSADLKNWRGAEYADVSSDYSSYSYVDGVYVAEKNGAHVEVWDFDTTDSASSWFLGNVDDLKAASTSNAGSHTSSSGDYTIKSGGKTYRILFCDDKGIYSYADDKDTVNNALSELKIK